MAGCLTGSHIKAIPCATVGFHTASHSLVAYLFQSNGVIFIILDFDIVAVRLGNFFECTNPMYAAFACFTIDIHHQWHRCNIIARRLFDSILLQNAINFAPISLNPRFILENYILSLSRKVNENTNAHAKSRQDGSLKVLIAHLLNLSKGKNAKISFKNS